MLSNAEAMKAAALKAAAGKHVFELFNVVALLDAAAERIHDATPTTAESMEMHIKLDGTLRLVQMAKALANTAADELFNLT